MNVVFKTGGKQYHASTGDRLDVELIDAEAGETYEFPEVLMVRDGEQLELGSPIVDGARVTARVIEHGRHPKIHIVKFKRRKHYRRQMGHRQHFTRVEITGVARG